jgi:hypothetical protein
MPTVWQCLFFCFRFSLLWPLAGAPTLAPTLGPATASSGAPLCRRPHYRRPHGGIVHIGTCPDPPWAASEAAPPSTLPPARTMPPIRRRFALAHDTLATAGERTVLGSGGLRLAAAWRDAARVQMARARPALSARRIRRTRLAAGAYVLGTINTNSCPAGSSVITAAAQCQAAATALGLRYDGTAASNFSPRGCARLTSTTQVEFNSHASGAADPDYAPVCAAAGAAVLCCALC